MKFAILAAAAALLATPAVAQTSTAPGQGTPDQSAVQGRSGSTAGGYRTDQGSGVPATTGSTSTGAGASGTVGGQSGSATAPSQQGLGTSSGNAPPARQ